MFKNQISLELYLECDIWTIIFKLKLEQNIPHSKQTCIFQTKEKLSTNSHFRRRNLYPRISQKVQKKGGGGDKSENREHRIGTSAVISLARAREK